MLRTLCDSKNFVIALKPLFPSSYRESWPLWLYLSARLSGHMQQKNSRNQVLICLYFHYCLNDSLCCLSPLPSSPIPRFVFTLVPLLLWQPVSGHLLHLCYYRTIRMTQEESVFLKCTFYFKDTHLYKHKSILCSQVMLFIATVNT